MSAGPGPGCKPGWQQVWACIWQGLWKEDFGSSISERSDGGGTGSSLVSPGGFAPGWPEAQQAPEMSEPLSLPGS